MKHNTIKIVRDINQTEAKALLDQLLTISPNGWQSFLKSKELSPCSQGRLKDVIEARQTQLELLLACVEGRLAGGDCTSPYTTDGSQIVACVKALKVASTQANLTFSDDALLIAANFLYGATSTNSGPTLEAMTAMLIEGFNTETSEFSAVPDTTAEALERMRLRLGE